MNKSPTKPTDEFYGRLQAAYDYFNLALFDNTLPHCLITVQREKNTMGFFSAARWRNDGKKDVHEIALNPAYFARRKVIEVFQTLVHEQCHVWQHEFGNPSRTGYHNREWSEKMESIGLMPSSTGEPGGGKLGQKMSDYPIEGGRFRQACIQLMTSGYQFNWIDRRIARQRDEYEMPTPGESQIMEATANITATASLAVTPAEAILDLPMTQLIPDAEYQLIMPAEIKVRAKTKYYCPGCEANVWGKPQLSIRCEDCDLSFVSV
ncbi:SprT-like domain-containing protein [Undibacterium sp.]|uniref:SprT-like domain-containing protein n=1 Tax=Undibacterium sp. TaxID=1914977 RepID=UPI00374CFDB5